MQLSIWENVLRFIQAASSPGAGPCSRAHWEKHLVTATKIEVATLLYLNTSASFSWYTSLKSNPQGYYCRYRDEKVGWRSPKDSSPSFCQGWFAKQQWRTLMGWLSGLSVEKMVRNVLGLPQRWRQQALSPGLLSPSSAQATRSAFSHLLIYSLLLPFLGVRNLTSLQVSRRICDVKHSAMLQRNERYTKMGHHFKIHR